MKTDNIEIDKVEMWSSPDGVQGIQISWWSGDIGWGTYTIVNDNGKWFVDDECMEEANNREFGKMLFSKWLDTLNKEAK